VEVRRRGTSTFGISRIPVRFDDVTPRQAGTVQAESCHTRNHEQAARTARFKDRFFHDRLEAEARPQETISLKEEWRQALRRLPRSIEPSLESAARSSSKKSDPVSRDTGSEGKRVKGVEPFKMIGNSSISC
jgi:hypothetical protein